MDLLPTPLSPHEASKVPCEAKSPLPKQMWRPKQKVPYKASGVAMPQARLSCEDKGKMPACFAEAISREARTAIMPSPNSGAVTPRTNLVLLSEVADDIANNTSTSGYARSS